MEADIPFATKRPLNVFYKGRKLDTFYVPDFVTHGGIVVELKAVSELTSEHEVQLFNYMRCSRSQVGYLINFGSKNSLEWKRYILSDLKVVSEEH